MNGTHGDKHYTPFPTEQLRVPKHARLKWLPTFQRNLHKHSPSYRISQWDDFIHLAFAFFAGTFNYAGNGFPSHNAGRIPLRDVDFEAKIGGLFDGE